MTATLPDLAIIIISYNTRQMTLAAIASARAETRTPHEIIVIDNASDDRSAEAIAQAHPDVRVIRESVNHGFGPAHQIALDHSRAPWVLLLNPDTIVLDRAIDRLMDFAQERPNARIWGGRTLYADGTLNPTSCFARMTLWSVLCRVTGLNAVFRRSALFNSEYYGDWPRDNVREVDIVTGCFLLIRRDFWDRLGGFDPVFTMYGEEVDMCLRARMLGARPIVTPNATIIHYGGASQPVRTDKLVRLLRAKMELIKRHFPAHSRRAGLLLFRLWPLSRTIALGVGARLRRSEELAHQAAIWREVWARRAEWETGLA
jgi:GT2 family glycosyltransferase